MPMGQDQHLVPLPQAPRDVAGLAPGVVSPAHAAHGVPRLTARWRLARECAGPVARVPPPGVKAGQRLTAMASVGQVPHAVVLAESDLAGSREGSRTAG